MLILICYNVNMNKKKYNPKIGDRFGRWTLIGKTESFWICQCDCGTIKNKEKIYSLIRGNSISCGCAKDEYFRNNNPMFDPLIKKKMSEIMKAKPEQIENIKKAVIKAQSPQIKEKRNQTNIKKYGCKSVLGNKKIQQKIKETNITKYGVPTPAQNPLVVKKAKQTCLQRYGETNHMKTQKYKDILSELNKKRRRADGIYTLPNGVSLVDYCNQKGIRPTSARGVLHKEGEAVMLEWLKNYSGHVSKLEIMLKNELNKNNISCIPHNRQIKELAKIGHKYRPDLKIENKDIYIDVDGLYIHATTKEKKYHLKKREVFEKNGIKLFQFYENEIKHKSHIIIGMIKSQINDTTSIGARTLILKEIPASEARLFMSKNHLMGGEMFGVKNISLISKNGEILCMMMYKKYKEGIDISRFATKIGYTIQGGLSKLLNYIELNEKPLFIQSFVDLRYSNGHSLESLGFERASVTLGWKWTDGKDVYNRLKCRANMDERGLSEEEHAKELRWHKLYDAGQAKYIKYINSPNMI